MARQTQIAVIVIGALVLFAGGVITGVLVGDEAEELLRRMQRGELPDMPVSTVVTYDSDHPENRETYVGVGDDDGELPPS